MLTKSEFADIVLHDYELKELKRFGKHLILAGPTCHALLEFGLVAEDSDIIGFDGKPISAGRYTITEKGIRYLEYRWMFGWRRIVKYIANHWIAFLALIVAILALLKP